LWAGRDGTLYFCCKFLPVILFKMRVKSESMLQQGSCFEMCYCSEVFDMTVNYE
jgi:hypothetical protein